MENRLSNWLGEIYRWKREMPLFYARSCAHALRFPLPRDSVSAVLRGAPPTTANRELMALPPGVARNNEYPRPFSRSHANLGAD